MGSAPVKILSAALAASLFAQSALAASGPSCPRRFAALVEDEVKQLKSVRYEEAWSQYHALLVEAPKTDREAFLQQARSMAQAYAEINPEFPTKDFMEFVEKEQGSLVMHRSAGATLEHAYAKFLATYEPASLALFEKSEGFRNFSKQLVERCGKSANCYAEEAPKLKAWVADSVKGSCLALSPAAVTELGRDLALSWGVMGTWYATQTDRSLKEFPFAFIANGLFWGAVFAERSCRKAVAASQKLPFGQAIADSKEASWLKRGIEAGKEELGEWKWYPIVATTSVGLTWWQDKIFDREKPPEHYAWRWSFIVLYNSVTGPIRRVLVVDPLFKRTFPALKRWIDGKVSAGKMAEVVTKAGSSGTDFGIRLKEWTWYGVAYSTYMKLAEDHKKE